MQTPKYDLLLQSESFHKSIANLSPHWRAVVISIAAILDAFAHTGGKLVYKVRRPDGSKTKWTWELPPADIIGFEP